jgi:hypothetical protein
VGDGFIAVQGQFLSCAHVCKFRDRGSKNRPFRAARFNRGCRQPTTFEQG